MQCIFEVESVNRYRAPPLTIIDTILSTIQFYTHSIIKKEIILASSVDIKKTLPKAQRIQGIEYFDSFNIFSSKQKPALKSWSNFSLVLFGKGQEKHQGGINCGVGSPHTNCGFWSNRALLYFALSVRPFVLRHRRDISTFLDILMVYNMKTIYFLNAYHLG